MVNLDTGSPHTAHTTNKVPLIIAGPKNADGALVFMDDKDRKEDEEEGALCDVAPTILAVLGLEQPKGPCLFKKKSLWALLNTMGRGCAEMSGRSLLVA
jgi:bisphosphoglycerate-independent phosphoglycerate mutase (AlkP superfamily)